MSYIYKIVNDINDKVYIGKTEFSIYKRFKEHCVDSIKRRTEKRPLYNAMNKYGIEHFRVELIEECDNPNEREVYWINQYNSYENGYNATKGGEGTRQLDYLLILKLYDTTNLSQKEIANECDCSPDSVRNIVSEYRENVDWVGRQKRKNLLHEPRKVVCVEKGLEFNSCLEAGKWLVSIGKSKSVNSAKNHIGECCRNKRKSCGGFTWQDPCN